MFVDVESITVCIYVYIHFLGECVCIDEGGGV